MGKECAISERESERASLRERVRCFHERVCVYALVPLGRCECAPFPIGFARVVFVVVAHNRGRHWEGTHAVSTFNYLADSHNPDTSSILLIIITQTSYLCVLFTT